MKLKAPYIDCIYIHLFQKYLPLQHPMSNISFVRFASSKLKLAVGKQTCFTASCSLFLVCTNEIKDLQQSGLHGLPKVSVVFEKNVITEIKIPSFFLETCNIRYTYISPNSAQLRRITKLAKKKISSF